MKTFWILLGIVLVLLFLGTRERLEPTDKIKAPDGRVPGIPYSDVETQRMVSMVPESVMQDHKRENRVDDALAQAQAGDMVYLFYEMVYKSATSPITESDVDKFVAEYSGGTGAALQGTSMENFYRAVLKGYFVDQQTPVEQPPAPEATPNEPINAPTESVAGQGLEPVTISPPPEVPPSPVQPVPVQPPSPDTTAPPVPLPGAPTGSMPAPANNQLPSRWTHACFFSPTN